VLKVLVLVALFALAVYLLVRTLQRGGSAPVGRRPAPPSSTPPRRPVAPDDDMDFLRDLDRKRLHPDDPEG
jgi:hypothetical protein